MNSDNYEFAKSQAPQSLQDNTPYKSKQWQYVNDINSSVYNNNGLSLVQFDLSSIYNSSGFSDPADLFLSIPIVMTANYGTAGPAIKAPPADCGFGALSLKTNYINLIHQIEVVASGKTVSDMQPHVNIAKHFKMLSQMTVSDLHNQGTTLGFSDVLDSTTSMQYNAGTPTTALQSGPSLTNNRAFNGNVASSGTQMYAGIQNALTVNEAIQRRVGRYIDVSDTTQNTLAGTLITRTQLANELRPFYEVVDTYTSVWYDYAIIRVKDLCDVLGQMGLTKKMDLLIRMYINTGSVVVAVGGTEDSNNGYYFTGQSASTFTNTCPLTVNYTGIALQTDVASITAGCFVARAPARTLYGTAVNAISSPMSACRAYYSIVELNDQLAKDYISQNMSKRVVYENIISNNYTNITSGGTFSQLIQSGIRAPVGLLCIPFIASSVSGFAQYSSCFDTCPATFSPLSLTNFQVSLGGVNQFAGSTMNYTFENFIEQISLASDKTSGTLGLSIGLINQRWWESNKVYYCDLTRGTHADKLTARNLSISFLNNSNVTIDILVFTVYNDQLELNVASGAVQRL